MMDKKSARLRRARKCSPEDARAGSAVRLCVSPLLPQSHLCPGHRGLTVSKCPGQLLLLLDKELRGERYQQRRGGQVKVGTAGRRACQGRWRIPKVAFDRSGLQVPWSRQSAGRRCS